ncbi:MAG: FAD:protein FMN transferase [Actinomycetota bacterium]
MGTSVQLAASGITDDQLAQVFAAIEEQERRWTRFSATSELAAINRAQGRPTVVSADTAAVIGAAIDAWQLTGGRFDPTVHDALIAAGYDRTFDAGPGPAGPTAPAPGLDDVQVDAELGVVTVPPATRLDLGGIGKGWAADVAAETLVALGAETAAVSIGGDVRVAGASVDGWPIQTDQWDEPIGRLSAGGFCFSTIEKRQWTIDGSPYHHIIDPATGHPASGSVRHAAIAAGTAARAEVYATAAVVAGWPAAEALLEGASVDGFVTTDDGVTHVVGTWQLNPSILASPADRSSRE